MYTMRSLFFTSRSTNDHLRTNEIQQRREIRVIVTESAPAPAPAPVLPPVPRSTASRSAPSLFSVSAMFGVRQGSCKSCR